MRINLKLNSAKTNNSNFLLEASQIHINNSFSKNTVKYEVLAEETKPSATTLTDVITKTTNSQKRQIVVK